MKNKPKKLMERLVSASPEIAGDAIAGALGFLAGDPFVAAVGAGCGVLMANAVRMVGEDILNRFLSEREQTRVLGVVAISANEINNRINNGEKLRDDNFFEKNNRKRSDAEEVVENIILKSQREPEEDKIQYLGYLLSNIAFDKNIGVHYAHQMIKTLEQLTYRQLCILKLSVNKNRFNLRNNDYRGQENFPIELTQLLYEYLDLYHRGLINFGGEVALGLADIIPGRTTVQGMGADIYNLTYLSKIPDAEIAPIVNQLI